MKSGPASALRCGYCRGGVLHELARFTVTTAEGQWPICNSCVRAMLDGIEEAHAEAGAVLEQLWELG